MKAEAFLAEGGYLWNAGIFLFRAGDYLAALARHGPAILEAAQRSLEFARRDGIHIRPDPEAFGAAPSLSIDYSVIEKADSRSEEHTSEIQSIMRISYADFC